MRLKLGIGMSAMAAVILTASAAFAGETKLFRLGTGGISGTYYPIGQVVAEVISNPLNKTECAPIPCGVPGLLAVGQASNGSVSNIAGIESRQLESGFSQSDIAHWARTGTGNYRGDGKKSDISSIASLYMEDVHLVVRKGSGIKNVRDLIGKNVSLDDPGSGTLVDARTILEAYGIDEEDMSVHYVKPAAAIKKMREGDLDAFFVIAGFPSKAVAELSEEGLISLIDISGPRARLVARENSFFSDQVIPSGVYEGIGEVRTLSVAALWIVSNQVSKERVYNITKTFWENMPATRAEGGHPKLSDITLDTAFDSLSVPLHAGAEQYYREIGRLPGQLVSN
ncbi:MAG: TAXI family TRAP transporter solute-binding subunit [Proteobacteria bacterium]|nr:TAXI family TRAP transporter solute-binding subunit [Pseudomonadota bacterium]